MSVQNHDRRPGPRARQVRAQAKRVAAGLWFPRPRGLLFDLAAAVVLVTAATLARLGLGLIHVPVMPFTIYFPAVLVAALLGGWRGGALAALLSGLLASYLFLAPPFGSSPPTLWAAVNLALYVAAAAAVVGVAASVRSLLARAWESQNALADRNLHYDTLFEAMSEGFALCDAVVDGEGRLTDYTILEMNPALQRMLGVGPEAVGTKLSDARGGQRRWLEVCGRVLASGDPEAFEFHNRATDLWHDIHISRVGDTQLAQFFFDITERKRAEARQGELFDELNHRVKNNLAMVASLLSLQARGAASPTVKDELAKAGDRVRSIAQVHASLYQGARRDDVEFAAYLRDLCAGLAEGLIDDGRITVEVEATPANLPVDTAIPLGMVVNELVTNATKYAYPAPQKGVIRVRFGPEGEELVLGVSDTGPGLPVKAQSRASGLGMRLVSSLVGQIQGGLTVGSAPGAAFEIRFPAP